MLMRMHILALVLLLLSTGCAPVFSPALADRADKSLTFDQLLSDPDRYIGTLVILGGVIEEISRHSQGTLLTIIQRPLDYWDRPQRTRRSGGRFLLFHPGLLDEMRYAPGREISAAAEVAGTRLGAFAELVFQYPVLVAKELRLWERRGPAPTSLQWGDPLYDRYRQPGRPE